MAKALEELTGLSEDRNKWLDYERRRDDIYFYNREKEGYFPAIEFVGEPGCRYPRKATPDHC